MRQTQVLVYIHLVCGSFVNGSTHCSGRVVVALVLWSVSVSWHVGTVYGPHKPGSDDLLWLQPEYCYYYFFTPQTC